MFHHFRGYMISAWLITIDIKLDHVVSMVSSWFLHGEVIFYHFHTTNMNESLNLACPYKGILSFTSWTQEYCDKQDCIPQRCPFPNKHPEPMSVSLWLSSRFSLCLCFQQLEDDVPRYAFCMYPAWFYQSLDLCLEATTIGNYQQLSLFIILWFCSSLFLLP